MDKDPRVFQISSKSFIDDGHGNVKGVNTIQIEWRKDANGRFQLHELPGIYLVFMNLISNEIIINLK